jgi:hypothetical protein
MPLLRFKACPPGVPFFRDSHFWIGLILGLLLCYLLHLLGLF